MKRYAFATLMAFATSHATATDPAKSLHTLSVAQFERGNVIGHLGHPLGTVVRVTGGAIDGNSTRARIDAHKVLLEVRAVNGMPLDRPVRFDHPYTRNNADIPKPGTKFDYFVHEIGSFSGIVPVPEGVSSAQPMVANDGFRYRRGLYFHSTHSRKVKGISDPSVVSER